LIRVTGDGFRAARVAGRFAADFFADFFAGVERDATFGVLFRFVLAAALGAGPALLLLALLVVLALRRAAPRFDAAADLLRDVPPDDFDAVAIIESLEGRYRTLLRKIRAQCRVR
jgi:hypothetical protein